MQFSGALKPELLEESALYAAELMSESSHVVHIILDMRRVAGVNKNTTTLRNMFAPMINHNSMGWCVAITSNLMLQTQLNRAVHSVTSKWGYVNNFSEAVRFVRQVDSSLSIVPISLADKPRSAHTIR